MQNAGGYQINSGILKMLVERVFATVADHTIGDGLGVRYVVFGVPADLVERVVAATGFGIRGRELQDPLPQFVPVSRRHLKVLAFHIQHEGALLPLQKSRDNAANAFTGSCGSTDENMLRAVVQEVMQLLRFWISPPPDVHPIVGVQEPRSPNRLPVGPDR